MSQIDYEELIRSPLDDLDSGPVSPWWAVLGGLVVGVLAGYLVVHTTGSGDPAPITTIVVDTTSTTAPTVVSDSPDYPPGYVEFAPDLGARVEQVITGDEVVTVAFATAVIRGADPGAVAWPRGGSWLLESASGASAESLRMVMGGFSPGAFSVQFPADAFNGETSFSSVRLLERWDTETHTGSTEIPFTGEPFAVSEALSIPVTQEVTLLIPRLELGRFQGLVEWQVVGADLGAAVDAVVSLFDEDEAEVGTYAAFPQIREPADTGVIDINWQRSFPIDQEGAVTLSLGYAVDTVSAIPVSMEFSLADVAVGQ